MKKIGWLTALTALVLLLGSALIARAELLPPRGEGQSGLQAVVLCETLTLRAEPDASSRALQTLRYGDLPIVVRQQDGWAYCVLGDAENSPSGWISTDYLAVDPARYRTEKATPVYAWNDTKAPKVALLDADTALPVLKDEGEWLVVSLRGAAGWIRVPSGAAEAPEGARRDGERFEGVIMLEGMEEKVLYEHAISAALGIEIDYEWESFARYRGEESERFISRWDDPREARDCLEIRFSAESADAVCASVAENLSGEYDIVTEKRTLEGAGGCTVIDASRLKGANETPGNLQTVYIIPAAGGCVTAWARCTPESAEGFGRRIDAMMHTLRLVNGQ